MTDRRSTTTNDVLIIGKIDLIIASMAKQDTKLAVIETKATATEEHLRDLNGKVQAHESRLQVDEGNITLNTRTILALVDASKASQGFWQNNREKMFWFVMACAWAYFMYTLR